MNALTSQAMLLAATGMLGIGFSNSQAISEFTITSLTVVECSMTATSKQEIDDCKSAQVNLVCELGMTAGEVEELYAQGRSEDEIMTQYAEGMTKCSIEVNE